MSIALCAVDGRLREAARSLLAEYLNWVAGEAHRHYGLHFDIDAMLASDLDDPAKFYAPHGRFYLIERAGAYVGVGCLKRISDAVAEVQRIYVKPTARGRGAARFLLEQLLEEAGGMGFSSVRLESLKCLEAAYQLYRSAGFEDTTPYANNGMQAFQPSEDDARFRAHTTFMERRL